MQEGGKSQSFRQSVVTGIILSPSTGGVGSYNVHRALRPHKWQPTWTQLGLMPMHPAPPGTNLVATSSAGRLCFITVRAGKGPAS